MSRTRKNGVAGGSVTLGDVEAIFLAIDRELADPATDYGTTKRLAERSKNLRALAEVVRARVEADEAIALSEQCDRVEELLNRRLVDTDVPFDAPVEEHDWGDA